jgi:hypothetical protein
MKKFFITLFIIAAGSILADTSAFSALSYGDIDPSLYNSTGYAYSDSLVLKNHNYAQWAYLANTSFSVSASYYLHSLETAGGKKSEYDRFVFEDISFALPFGDRNFFGFSYYPVAIADITGVTETETALYEDEDVVLFRQLETKKGSISNASLVYGKGFGGFSAAVNGSFKFGNYDLMRRYEYISYTGTSINWAEYYEKKEKTQLFHFTMGAGFFYKTPAGIDIGGSFSLPLSSYGAKIRQFDRTTSYGSVIAEISEEDYEFDAEWPVEYGAGLSYKISNFLLSLDHSVKAFGSTDPAIDDTEMNDYTRTSLGISFDPRKRKFDPYYKRMVYSANLSVEKRPYGYNGNAVWDVTETLGFILPFNDDKTAAEFKFSFTKSGDKTENGLSDNIIKFQLNLISSDKWRLKKDRYND